MSRVRELSRCFMLVVAASALSFGAAEALRFAGDECGDEPGELGTCPPYNPVSCTQDCWELYGTEGECGPSGDGPCCRCQVK